MEGKRGYILAVSSVLCLALLFSCSPATGDLTKDGVISLTIGTPSASRSIDVTQYDVSSLDVEIFSPGGASLWNETWTEDQGVQTYDIEVEMLGTHEIVVVHHGINGDDSVSATESGEFTIASMLITVINITPGAIGVLNINGDDVVAEDCLIVGVWENTITMWFEEWDGDVLIDEYPGDVLLQMSFDNEGNVEMITYMLDEFGVPDVTPIEAFSMKGTYECPEDGILSGYWTHWYSEELDDWEEDPDPEYWQVGVEFPDDDTVIVDVSAMGMDPWTLYRQ